ncbi:hypothetical protein BH24CHL3_BH24CHL3_08400 [soil metagenome]
MTSEGSSVNDRSGMDFESLLGAAAFGTLTAEEASGLMAYLATSDAARAELAQLRVIAGVLPLLTDEREPSPGLRGRIEQAVRATPHTKQREPGLPLPTTSSAESQTVRPLEFSTQLAPTPIEKAPGWRNYVWALAASLLIAVLAGVMLDRIFLQAADDDLEGRETIAFELTLPTPVDDLSAELTYDPDRQLFVLETENMPAAPEGQIYQVWLIDGVGPRPVGVMVDSTFALAANRDNYAAFAITVEPAPNGSPAPTTTPFFVAELAPADADA